MVTSNDDVFRGAAEEDTQTPTTDADVETSKRPASQAPHTSRESAQEDRDDAAPSGGRDDPAPSGEDRS